MQRSERPDDAAAAVCIVGMGPRGTSVLERLAASLREFGMTEPLTVYAVDPFAPGAGRVWHNAQSPEMAMNTLAGEVTLFTDTSVRCSGPVVEGPNLYQWAQLLLGVEPLQAVTDAARAMFSSSRVPGHLTGDDRMRSELEAMRPWSHPSRVAFGEYLSWCYGVAAASLPDSVTLEYIADYAVSLTPGKRGRDIIRLRSGRLLRVDATVLSVGWLDVEDNHGDIGRIAELDGFPWIRPASPIEQDFSMIAPESHVIVRGLGMGFFDAMAMLTIERGGRFEPSGTGHGLRYLPSGNEPVMHVGSRRGVPFRSKPVYDSLPPKAEQKYVRALERPAGGRKIDFREEVWPLIRKDAVRAYYSTLAQYQPEAFAADPQGLLELLDDVDPAADVWQDAVAGCVPDPAHRFSLSALTDPVPSGLASHAQFQAWVRQYVADDLAEGRRGSRSALKAAAWSIGSARGPAGHLAAHGGFAARSFPDYKRFQALGGMLGSGPPAFRSEQLLALMSAGLVEMIGPQTAIGIDPDNGQLVAASPQFPDWSVRGDALLDAWMHSPSAGRCTDPVLVSLRSQGLTRAFAITDPDGTEYSTGTFEISRSLRIVGSAGDEHQRVFLFGIPADGIGESSIASPLPETNSPFLRETDSVARSVLRIVRNHFVPDHPSGTSRLQDQRRISGQRRSAHAVGT